MQSPKRSLAAVAVLWLVGGAPAYAVDWKFELFNKSERTITSYVTFDDGEWGDNWLAENIAPDEAFDMEYSSDSGNCKMPTRIEFTSGAPYESEIDYCALKVMTIRNADVTVE